MFNYIKKNLYNYKKYLLINEGIREGKIVEFDNEFYSKMKDVIINDIPVYFHIKYLKPNIDLGKCYDRSLYMFFCYPESFLVRGDNKELEYIYGKEYAGHGWLELGDYVYDPSLLLRFDKNLYYQIYSPSNVTKISKEEYNTINNGYYDEVVNFSKDDIMPNGKKRHELLVNITIVKEMADLLHNEEFKYELDEYLESIEYDEEQIYEKLNQEIDKIMSKKIN